MERRRHTNPIATNPEPMSSMLEGSGVLDVVRSSSAEKPLVNERFCTLYWTELGVKLTAEFVRPGKFVIRLKPVRCEPSPKLRLKNPKPL
jgi:hypothetical protein